MLKTSQEIREAFAKNLSMLFAITKKSQKDLAEYVGVKPPSVNAWLKGTKLPRMDRVDKICAFFAVNRSTLLESHEDIEEMENIYKIPNIIPVAKKKIPLLGSVAAGEPIYADEHIEEYLPVDDDMHADFALHIEGDSMINANIDDGDIVFVRKQPDVDDGQIAVVLIDDGATVKRVYKFESYVQLMPENPKYKPMIFNDENCDLCKILGLVVAVLKRIG